jgi:hypothetical protein
MKTILITLTLGGDMKSRPFFVPKVPRIPAVVFLTHDLVPQDEPIYIPPEESDEDRWSREYDEENDPDPWGSDCECEDPEWDQVEDWELLGMDSDSTQEEIDDMWENQM